MKEALRVVLKGNRYRARKLADANLGRLLAEFRRLNEFRNLQQSVRRVEFAGDFAGARIIMHKMFDQMNVTVIVPERKESKVYTGYIFFVTDRDVLTGVRTLTKIQVLDVVGGKVRVRNIEVPERLEFDEEDSVVYFNEDVRYDTLLNFARGKYHFTVQTRVNPQEVRVGFDASGNFSEWITGTGFVPTTKYTAPDMSPPLLPYNSATNYTLVPGTNGFRHYSWVEGQNQDEIAETADFVHQAVVGGRLLEFETISGYYGDSTIYDDPWFLTNDAGGNMQTEFEFVHTDAGYRDLAYFSYENDYWRFVLAHGDEVVRFGGFMDFSGAISLSADYDPALADGSETVLHTFPFIGYGRIEIEE